MLLVVCLAKEAASLGVLTLKVPLRSQLGRSRTSLAASLRLTSYRSIMSERMALSTTEAGEASLGTVFANHLG